MYVMKRFNVNLPDELHEKLREKSFKENKSMSEVIVDAIYAVSRDTSENIPPAKPTHTIGRSDKKIKTCKHGSMIGLCKMGCR